MKNKFGIIGGRNTALTQARDPMERIKWLDRCAQINDPDKNNVFNLNNLIFPEFWSENAVNITAMRFLSRNNGEISLANMVRRVCSQIARWGLMRNTFSTEDEMVGFQRELEWLCLNQYFAFNSPVWFNVGINKYPQCSACFILPVEDNLSSIMDLAKIEVLLCAQGAGCGTNLSTIRSSREKLKEGIGAPGPISFMRGFDEFIGTIRSGGTSRRAAKMIQLNIDHPDIIDFIRSKETEEEIARILINNGFSSQFGVRGNAYDAVKFQNSNHSVRISDDFMRSYLVDGIWETLSVESRRPIERYSSRDVLATLVHSAWTCGDPGIQFDSTINMWNTCSSSGRINASNPCAEFHFLDNTACNLASINLRRYLDNNGNIKWKTLKRTVHIAITALDILVDFAGYPSDIIHENTLEFRPLGLGITNLGSLLMSMGIAYNSEDGRAVASAITSYIGAHATIQSAKLARLHNPFLAYKRNESSVKEIIQRHSQETEYIEERIFDRNTYRSLRQAWKVASSIIDSYGCRNAQLTAIAPTGTISLMMDCDTTGIEPEISLIKYKSLIGGGVIQMENKSIAHALTKLLYSDAEIALITSYIRSNGVIEGAPSLQDKHFGIFECAINLKSSKSVIDPLGHLKMVSALQRFVSGGISKTVNLPANATKNELEMLILQAWRMGIKAISFYRDGSKSSQPINFINPAESGASCNCA